MASRPKRWAKACRDARNALGKMQYIFDNDLLAALEDLQGLKDEYDEWNQSLPENLQDSPVAEKLTAVEDIDIDSMRECSFFDEAESILDEAEGLDLPMGFGRD